MATRNTIQALPAISFDSSSLTGSYIVITPASGTLLPISLLKYVNNSTKDISVSYDGSTEHDFIPSMTSSTLNFQSNNQPSSQSSVLQKGTKIYINGTAGTGDFYVIAYVTAQGV